jgi:hypothetical protein
MNSSKKARASTPWHDEGGKLHLCESLMSRFNHHLACPQCLALALSKPMSGLYDWLGSGTMSIWWASNCACGDVFRNEGVEDVVEGGQSEAITSRKG